MGCDANGSLTCRADLHPQAAEMEGVGGESGTMELQCIRIV